MPPRSYRLGKRQPSIERTRQSIVDAARTLIAEGGLQALSLEAVAQAAGVSRITVYNRFGSKAGLVGAVTPPSIQVPSTEVGAPRDQLRQHLVIVCSRWAANPALFRRLPSIREPDAADGERRLAERLAECDDLRPGCSIKEAEDVIGALTSFDLFDRLHKDGRRPPAAVAEILMRLASGILH